MFSNEVIITSDDLRMAHLRHDAQSFPQALQTNITNVLASNEDVALLRLVETKEQSDNRALSKNMNK